MSDTLPPFYRTPTKFGAGPYGAGLYGYTYTLVTPGGSAALLFTTISGVLTVDAAGVGGAAELEFAATAADLTWGWPLSAPCETGTWKRAA